MFEGIEWTDALLFVVGIVVGIGVSFVIGKYVFNRFFKKAGKQITIENVGKFSVIQQGINYVLGFALGTMVLAPIMALPIFLVWLTFQTWLAGMIFGFSRHIYGFTFVTIDTFSDLGLGVLFGQGAATFQLVVLSLGL